VTADSNDVSTDAALQRHRHHADNYLSVDCDKPLNLEMNKTHIRSPQTPLSDHHSTPTYTAGLSLSLSLSVSLCIIFRLTHIHITLDAIYTLPTCTVTHTGSLAGQKLRMLCDRYVVLSVVK